MSELSLNLVGTRAEIECLFYSDSERLVIKNAKTEEEVTEEEREYTWQVDLRFEEEFAEKLSQIKTLKELTILYQD